MISSYELYRTDSLTKVAYEIDCLFLYTSVVGPIY